MDLFLDITSDQALSFVSFLKRLTSNDYERISLDPSAADDAQATGSELILAFRDLGFITAETQSSEQRA